MTRLLQPSEEPALVRRRMRVPMKDVDFAGVIYFGVVYGWHEGLYTSWLVELGHPLSSMVSRGTAAMTVSSGAEYVRPLRLDDVVLLELATRHIGRTSFTLQTRCFKEGESEWSVLVESTHVWSQVHTPGGNAAAGIGPQPLPDWLREGLGRRDGTRRASRQRSEVFRSPALMIPIA